MNKTIVKNTNKYKNIKHKRKNKTIKKSKKLYLENNNKEPIIKSNFESGSIIQHKLLITENKIKFFLEFDYDYPNNNNEEYSGWFYFSVSNVLFKNCDFVLEKPLIKGGSWKNYRPVYSYNNKNWKYLKNVYFNTETLKFSIKPSENKIFIAYYIPFKKRDYNNFKGILEKSFLFNNSKLSNYKCKKIQIGYSFKNQPIFFYKITDKRYEKHNQNLWLIAGQSSIETMGIYTLKGFILRLIKDNASICKKYNIYFIIQCNPDGNYYGKSYVNSKGYNLKYNWLDTKYNKTPEVFLIKKAIEAYGCNMLINIECENSTTNHYISYKSKYNPHHNEKIEKVNEILETKNKNFIAKDCLKDDSNLESKYVNDSIKTIVDYGEMFLNATTFTVKSAIQNNNHSIYKDKKIGILYEPYKLGSDLYFTLKDI